MKYEIIETYEQILNGTLNHFPDKTWTKSDAKINALILSKYFIEVKLKYSIEDIKENLSTKMFKDNKLYGMLQVVFNGSVNNIIQELYPNKIHSWEYEKISVGYWSMEEGIKATKWLIEEKLKYSDDDIRDKLSIEDFRKYKLSGMIEYMFNNSLYEAINTTYPNKFNPWEINKTPRNYWNRETGIIATKWLVEEKMKLSHDEVVKLVTIKTFKNSKLGGMLSIIYNNSVYSAINDAYPGEYKPWEFSKTPKGYWNLSTAKSSTRWLVEEKLKTNNLSLVSKEDFRNNGLGGMLRNFFKDSVYLAIAETYPNVKLTNVS